MINHSNRNHKQLVQIISACEPSVQTKNTYLQYIKMMHARSEVCSRYMNRDPFNVCVDAKIRWKTQMNDTQHHTYELLQAHQKDLMKIK
jgi:hypothetical protein